MRFLSACSINNTPDLKTNIPQCMYQCLPNCLPLRRQVQEERVLRRQSIVTGHGSTCTVRASRRCRADETSWQMDAHQPGHQHILLKSEGVVSHNVASTSNSPLSLRILFHLNSLQKFWVLVRVLLPTLILSYFRHCRKSIILL